MTESRNLPTTTSPERSGLVTTACWTLFVLATLFTVGALGQFFLVGLSMFDDAARWQDHATLGHIIGLIPYLLWIPAMLGKVRRAVLLGTLALFVLFWAQYAFINVDSGIANALHPLNGAVLLVLGAWISVASLTVARGPAAERPPRSVPDPFNEEVA